jgi:hypothetical protein
VFIDAYCVCVSEKGSELSLKKKILQALTVLGEAELSADKCSFEDTFGPGCSLMGSRCLTHYYSVFLLYKYRSANTDPNVVVFFF